MKVLIFSIIAIMAAALFAGPGITGFIALRGFEGLNAVDSLGYCPSMKEYANNNYDAKNYVEYSSSLAALKALEAGLIDCAIIGRMPLNYEFTGECEMLENGFTLVSLQKRFIDYYEIENLRIHTYLSKEIVDEFLPLAKNVVFHESVKSALNYLNETVLIDWQDYDNYELVVPGFGNEKAMEFRVPTLCAI